MPSASRPGGELLTRLCRCPWALPGLLRDTAAFLRAWERGGLGHEDEEGARMKQQPERAQCLCLSEIANPRVAAQASLNKERFLSSGCPV